MNAAATFPTVESYGDVMMEPSRPAWRARRQRSLQSNRNELTDRLLVGSPQFGMWLVSSAVSSPLDQKLQINTVEKTEERSAVAPLGSARQDYIRLPEPTELPSASHHLRNNRVRATLGRLFPMIEELVRHEEIPVRRLKLFGFRDTEEGWQQLVVSLSVNVPEREALLFWDKLGHFIEGQLELLPHYMVDILYDRISIEVLGDLEEAV